ncbi:MAG: helix-turn-helix domain-containing protein [Kofleriaceae bacterium]|nr:helix-turn-helix domain-containing protein [Kofleriaceae bacterium]
MDRKTLSKARLSRDPRFDGCFFVAVKTTGIYCRPICPAPAPKESNVEYYTFSYQAALAGYRPCLRCRPDSAPSTPAWKGVSATVDRAKRLIDEGALHNQPLASLCTKLGVGPRHLRQVFNTHLGISPKSYSLFRQCEFAKELLHQTTLPITEIAYASGFNSVRRFNDSFKKQLRLTPSQVRKSVGAVSNTITLLLNYRPPYDWTAVHLFLSRREMEGLEVNTPTSYGRDVRIGHCTGRFNAKHNPEKNRFEVDVEVDDLRFLQQLIRGVRRVLDMDSDSTEIETHLRAAGFTEVSSGLRLPGTWTVFEAGVRAILGQQISLTAATQLVQTLVNEYPGRGFPTPEWINGTNLEFLAIPKKRRACLTSLAQHFLEDDDPRLPSRWQSIPGIGPWTTNYAQMRGLSAPDIFLGGDLIVKKALRQQPNLDIEACAPFRSYATLELWKAHS